jgi:hypothetical protein
VRVRADHPGIMWYRDAVEVECPPGDLARPMRLASDSVARQKVLAIGLWVADAAGDGQRGRRTTKEVHGGGVAGGGQCLVVSKVDLTLLHQTQTQ